MKTKLPLRNGNFLPAVCVNIETKAASAFAYFILNKVTPAYFTGEFYYKEFENIIFVKLHRTRASDASERAPADNEGKNGTCAKGKSEIPRGPRTIDSLNRFLTRPRTKSANAPEPCAVTPRILKQSE